MSGSASGSGSDSSSGSGDAPVSSFVSSVTLPWPTSTPTPVMAGDDSDAAAVSTSLAVAVVALLFSIAMTIIVLVMFYFLVKLRRDVRRLQPLRDGGTVAKIENGSSPMALTRLDHSTNIITESLDQKPPPSPHTAPESPPSHATPKSPPSPLAIPKGTTPLQSIQHTQFPPGPGYEDLELESEPQRSATPRDGYDNVNLLVGVLPPELRTEENLEGRRLEPEEVKRMEEAERKMEESYEDMGMRMKREEDAMEAVRRAAKPTSVEQGEVADDDYTNPADAIDKDGKVSKVLEPQKHKKEEGKEGKRFVVGSVQNEEHVPTMYTDVFDQLPTGEREVVTKQAKTGSQPTSPPVETKSKEGVVRRINPCGYEDIPDDMLMGPRSAPCQESPLSANDGTISGQPGTPSGERENGKTELLKRYSHPHPRRDARKEMVEVNPRSRKPVTLSSGRRKQLQREQGEGGGGGGGDVVDREGTTDGPATNSANSSPTSKPKTFSVSSDSGSMQDCYAMVDMAGKYRYRAESDSMKREGSGAPKHYTVKERPPETVMVGGATKT